jgi:hypothetical protein
VDNNAPLVDAFCGWLAFQMQATNIRHKRSYNTRVDRRQLASDEINARRALELQLLETYGAPSTYGSAYRKGGKIVSGNTALSFSVL